MSFDPDDPKWTAYVLDELDSAERAAVDQELADSSDARELIGELRETATLLESSLQSESAYLLSSQQRAVVVGQFEHKVELPIRRRIQPKTVAEWVAAVSVLFILSALLLPATQSAREAGRRNPAAQSTPNPSAGKQTLPSRFCLQDDVHHRSPSHPPTAIESPPESEPVQADFDGLIELITTTVKPTTWGDQPVVYPDAKVWEELTERRLKYSVSDLKNGVSSDVLTLSLNGRFGEGQATVRDGSSASLHDLQTELQSLMEVQKRIEEEARRSKSGKLVRIMQRNAAEIARLKAWFAEHEGTESYDIVTDNPFLPARRNPLSTFSIDVDTASYANIRRFLTQNHALPPKGAVRIEEMINYFRYDYPQPEGDAPFSVTTEVAGCPWHAEHRLVRVGLKGREIEVTKRPPSNLVFLLDVSGSMTDANKLPLVREAMKLLAEQLAENDRVAIVGYAGSTGCVLESTPGNKHREIREAIDRLQPGGSTNGSGGIQLAYELAVRGFIKGGTNRVILATDGDFNVGVTHRDDLIRLITEQAKSGVFLTTLGFGMGNLKDATLEQLADKGNGNYAYIDDLREAKKVFVEQMSGTLITIAKDVKVQIEFNPAQVASYRLIGYENRVLAHEDFNDDKKDAGEIGAGHTVTALYEIVPAAGAAAAADGSRSAVDPLRYQQQQPQVEAVKNGELLTLKLRYKQPDGDTSKLIEQALTDTGRPHGKATADFKFASAVALFGMILRDSPHKGTGTIDAAEELAREGLSKDDGGYRTEFVDLVKQAKVLGRR